MTSVVGWTGRRSSPSTRGFSCSCGWATVAIRYSACGWRWAAASAAFTAWPPNWLRSAALTFAANAFCPRGELAEPRAHDRALHPEVRDLRVVELILA